MQEIKIDLYISDLLYSYDCVIVPDFGGFVANYASAEIKPIQHKFIPPTKSISFNKNLKNNDGLLLDHIAQRQSISYQEAKQLVHAFVNQSIQGLNQGDRIYFEKIGILYLDPEGNIQFEAEEQNDFLLDSFGMSAIKAKPILRRSKVEAIEEQVEKVIPLVKQEEKKKRKFYWPAAAIFFFFLSTALMIEPKISTSQLQFSELKFWTNETGKYSSTHIEKLEALTENKADYELSVETELYKGAEHLYIEGEIAEEDNTEVVMETPKSFIYHVMGGCFSNEDNASKLVGALKADGYDSRLLGQYKSLHAVSYQSFATREQAVKFLAQVKNDHNPNAWLLIKTF